MQSKNGKAPTQLAGLKSVTWLVIMLLQFSLIVGCSSAQVSTTLPPVPTVAESNEQSETNFGFIFEYGTCSTNVLDTFKAEYIQDRSIYEPSITISLALSVEQMKEIRQKTYAIGLPQYPAVYVIPTPLDGVMSKITPAPHYKLTVVDGETITTVSWVDDITQPTAPEADRLRELFEMIVKMIDEHPDFKKLPKLPFGCA